MFNLAGAKGLLAVAGAMCWIFSFLTLVCTVFKVHKIKKAQHRWEIDCRLECRSAWEIGKAFSWLSFSIGFALIMISKLF